jgi:hypothetical protein
MTTYRLEDFRPDLATGDELQPIAGPTYVVARVGATALNRRDATLAKV